LSSLAGKNLNSWNSIQPSGLRCLEYVNFVNLLYLALQVQILGILFGKGREAELTQKLARKVLVDLLRMEEYDAHEYIQHN